MRADKGCQHTFYGFKTRPIEATKALAMMILKLRKASGDFSIFPIAMPNRHQVEIEEKLTSTNIPAMTNVSRRKSPPGVVNVVRDDRANIRAFGLIH